MRYFDLSVFRGETIEKRNEMCEIVLDFRFEPSRCGKRPISPGVVYCGMSNNDRTRVRDMMSTPLKTISADATVTEAAKVMRDDDISALVVTTSPRAIISSSDVLEVAADGLDPTEVQVSDVMTEDVETVTPDLYMEEVAAMMTTFGIKHLPVVDDEYVGMVSSTDVATLLS
jgi:CBS domain-containing protein